MKFYKGRNVKPEKSIFYLNQDNFKNGIFIMDRAQYIDKSNIKINGKYLFRLLVSVLSKNFRISC